MTYHTFFRALPIIVGGVCASIAMDVSAVAIPCFTGTKNKVIHAKTQKFRSTSPLTQSLPDRREAAILLKKQEKERKVKSKGSSDLIGSISGDWDFVTGWISFPYTTGDGENFQALIRGFDGTKQTGDEYSFSGWDGNVFWADTGDGIPHLVPSQLVTDDFTPLEDDVFTQSGKLYDAGFVLFREQGEDYPIYKWEEAAAWSHLLYVTDDAGQLLEVVVDLYDDNDEYIGSTIPSAGDQLQMIMHAYDLKDPSVVWMLQYMDFKTLTGPLSIEKWHYLPGVDFTDPDLMARVGEQFDASTFKLELLLDAGRPDRLDTTKFAFNTPQPLGYTWGEAKQKFSSNSTTSIPAESMASTGGGGTFDWVLLLLGGIGSYRIVTSKKRNSTKRRA